MAKLITHGRDRAEAVERMRRALDMFVVEGIYTTMPLHHQILANEDFLVRRLDTQFLGRLGGGK